MGKRSTKYDDGKTYSCWYCENLEEFPHAPPPNQSWHRNGSRYQRCAAREKMPFVPPIVIKLEGEK